jgi:hypothetical protein
MSAPEGRNTRVRQFRLLREVSVKSLFFLLFAFLSAGFAAEPVHRIDMYRGTFALEPLASGMFSFRTESFEGEGITGDGIKGVIERGPRDAISSELICTFGNPAASVFSCQTDFGRQRQPALLVQRLDENGKVLSEVTLEVEMLKVEGTLVTTNQVFRTSVDAEVQTTVYSHELDLTQRFAP